MLKVFVFKHLNLLNKAFADVAQELKVLFLYQGLNMLLVHGRTGQSVVMMGGASASLQLED